MDKLTPSMKRHLQKLVRGCRAVWQRQQRRKRLLWDVKTRERPNIRTLEALRRRGLASYIPGVDALEGFWRPSAEGRRVALHL